MKGISKDPIGLTQDSGWQIGVRRTILIPVGKLWEFMISKQGTDIWLGSDPKFHLQLGEVYELADGTTGKV